MITFVAVLIVLGSIGVAGWPLLKGSAGSKKPGLMEDTKFTEILAEKDAVLLAISELESDYEMGNLSKKDFEELRKKYEEKAFNLIKIADELQGERGLDEISQLDQEIEERVSNLRSRKERPASEVSKTCLSCGASVLPDDTFCFRCGTALSLKCPHCSRTARQDERFCAACGAALGNGGKK